MGAENLVYIVDDDPEMRRSMEWLIGSAGLTARVFSSPVEFIAAYDPRQVSVLILDVRMPEMTGLELQSQLRNHQIELPLIFISGHASVAIAVEAMKKGAVEFLTKPFNDQVLLDAIHKALKRDGLRHSQNQELSFINKRLARLTKREKEILDLVVAAKSSKSIAAELGISYKTVELHRSRIIEKMEVNSAIELAQLINKLTIFDNEITMEVR